MIDNLKDAVFVQEKQKSATGNTLTELPNNSAGPQQKPLITNSLKAAAKMIARMRVDLLFQMFRFWRLGRKLLSRL